MVTTYMANAGNALAVMGQVEAGMLRGGRAAATQTRQLGVMEQQFRALGTTIRYALAGGLVFGVAGLVGKLNQLQQQLGLIAAIAPTAGVDFSKGGLGQYLNDIEQRAVAARTPVEELNNSTINFLSTVQMKGAKKGDIADIVAQIGITAKLSQTPTEDLTKAVTTLNIAAGRTNNIKNINALLREWFNLISTVPGGIAAAPQIAQQLGPLASVGMTKAARMTPEQLFGISTAALRYGATPSTALRGEQYFIQSLTMPKGKYATTLAAHGFSLRRLQAQGGAGFIFDYLKELQRIGNGKTPSMAQAKQFGALADANPEADAGLEPNQQISGMTPAQVRFLNNTIGRIHGIRTAMTLLAQLGQHGDVAGLDQLLATYKHLKDGTGKISQNLKTAQDEYRKQTQLQAASVALDVLKTKTATAMAPFLNPIAGVITGAEGLATRHPHATNRAIQGFMAALGVAGLGRLAGFRMPRILGRLSRGAGQGFVVEQALQAAAKGGGAIGSAPTNPLYVIVVGQLFGGGGSSAPGNWKTPGSGGPGGTVLTAEEKAAQSAKAGKFAWVGKTARVAGAATIVGAAESQIPSPLGHHRTVLDEALKYSGANAILQLGRWAGQGKKSRGTGFFHTMQLALGEDPYGAFNQKQNYQYSNNNFSRHVLKTVDSQVDSANKLFLNALKPIMQHNATEVSGGVDLKITIDDGGKKKDARVHIPLSTVHEGGRVPISRGKRKSARVDFTIGTPRAGGK